MFLAAKTEEIYPPKLSEFSYVTDGACTDKEILEKEILVLKVCVLFKLKINSLSNLRIILSFFRAFPKNRRSQVTLYANRSPLC